VPETREVAVVDVGFEPEAVIGWLEEHDLEPRCCSTPTPTTIMSRACAPCRRRSGASIGSTPATVRLLKHLSEQGAMFGLPPAAAPAVVHDLEDGQRIRLGNQSLVVIHTPGHSRAG